MTRDPDDPIRRLEQLRLRAAFWAVIGAAILAAMSLIVAVSNIYSGMQP